MVGASCAGQVKTETFFKVDTDGWQTIKCGGHVKFAPTKRRFLHEVMLLRIPTALSECQACWGTTVRQVEAGKVCDDSRNQSFELLILTKIFPSRHRHRHHFATSLTD